MFEVTKGNMKILFESPFLVADYVYKNTRNVILGYKTFSICCELLVGSRYYVEESKYINDGEVIFIKRIS